jgi:hypothetical protein
MADDIPCFGRASLTSLTFVELADHLDTGFQSSEGHKNPGPVESSDFCRKPAKNRSKPGLAGSAGFQQKLLVF